MARMGGTMMDAGGSGKARQAEDKKKIPTHDEKDEASDW
jgi:hypothetical protein